MKCYWESILIQWRFSACPNYLKNFKGHEWSFKTYIISDRSDRYHLLDISIQWASSCNFLSGGCIVSGKTTLFWVDSMASKVRWCSTKSVSSLDIRWRESSSLEYVSCSILPKPSPWNNVNTSTCSCIDPNRI